MNNFIDFTLLFDRSKQPFKFKSDIQNKTKTSGTDDLTVINTVSGSGNSLVNAIDDFKYEENYPLEEFFIYNGSFTKPSCEENVTYIVDPNPKIAPLNQIIVILF